MSVVSDFLAAGVVVLTPVSQLDTGFGCGRLSFVGVTSVEKGSHGCPQKITSPRSVAWIVCASRVRGERLVALATEIP